MWARLLGTLEYIVKRESSRNNIQQVSWEIAHKEYDAIVLLLVKWNKRNCYANYFLDAFRLKYGL